MKTWLIIVIAFVVLLLIGGGLYAMKNKKNKENTDKTETTVKQPLTSTGQTDVGSGGTKSEAPQNDSKPSGDEGLSAYSRLLGIDSRVPTTSFN